jgi:hypothetical protein
MMGPNWFVKTNKHVFFMLVILGIFFLDFPKKPTFVIMYALSFFKSIGCKSKCPQIKILN